MTRSPTPKLLRWRAQSPPDGEDGPPEHGDGPPPSNARVYDYLLGGKDNYAADRELAEWALRRCPVLQRVVQANRGFLDDAAARLAEDAGLRQFVDIGCGLPRPCGSGIGDVVRRVDPSCRIVYVDNDPLVLVHARALLAVDDGTAAVEGDVRDPAALLGAPGLRNVIDVSEPVGVLLGGVLDTVSDEDDPAGVVRALAAALAPGSHIVITHTERTPELEPIAGLPQNPDLPFWPRDEEAINEIVASLEMTGPYPIRLPSPSVPRAADPLPLFACIGRVPG
ncbi:MAG TPA: SAM-dependent methyltransferase [Spirillospora sp.]